MNLVHLIVRQWRQRPARTALSIASVAIAVAAVLGVTLAQSSVRLAFRELLAVTEGRPAVEIVAIAGGRFDAARTPSLDDLDGVRATTPLVTRATLARVRGKRFRAVLLGIPTDDAEIRDALPLVEGTWFGAPRQALVSADLAKSLKIGVGDRLIVLGRRGPHAAKIVGLVNSAALRELAPSATLVTPIGEIQQLYGLGNQINRLRVALESSSKRETVQEAVGARLPDDLVVQAPVAQMELAGGVLRSTEMALRFAGVLSMAMAALIVLNTLRMNFGERRRDMAVLRVLGVTSGQLVGLHVIEGLVLGFIGAALGIPAGLAMGRGLAALMQRLAETEITNPATPYWTLAAALVVGPLVAGLAALVPALQSRGISPVEALSNTETRRGEQYPWWSVVGGAVCWSLAAVLLVLVDVERLAAEAAIPAGVLMLVGFIAVIPAVLAPVIRFVARLLAPWTRMEGQFAAEQLLQRPTRTGLTVGVLVVAISTGLGMGNAIINNVDDVRSWYRRMTAADIMLAGPSAADGAVEIRNRKNVRQVVAAQPGVEFVVETRFFPARASGVPALCIVHEFDTRLELLWTVSPREDRTLRTGLNAGDVVVGSVLARRLALGVGDILRLEIQGRVLPLRICGVVRDYAQGGLVVYLNQTSAAELIDVGAPSIYTVSTKTGTPIGPLVEQLTALLDEEGLVIQSLAELRQQLDLLVGGIVAALWGLLVIGFVVGGFAVANTLTMSVFEQTRELGLLRVIGMTRRQVRKLVLCESLLLGILGVVMGTLAGLTTAWIIHLCNEPLLGYSIPFTLHTWLVVANAVTCLAITMLAAWLPGERAARLDFLSAIAYE